MNDEDFEPGNPDNVGRYPGEPQWVGDKPNVAIIDETEPDEMSDHSDDQGWDKEEYV